MNRGRTGPGLSFLLFLLILAAPAIGKEDGEISKPVNLWPLLYHEKGPDRAELEALFYLLHYERENSNVSWTLRPLFWRNRDPEHRRWSWRALWQLANYQRQDQIQKLRILPLFWQRLAPTEAKSILFPLYNYHRNDRHRKLGLLGYRPLSAFDFRKDLTTGATKNRFLLFSHDKDDSSSSMSLFPLFFIGASAGLSPRPSSPSFTIPGTVPRAGSASH